MVERRSSLVLITFDAKSASDWRSWLRRNHLSSQGIWLIFRRKNSGSMSLSYDEAMDEALAYGWIDSMIRKLDDRRYARKFTPRRPGSIWSRPNIERVNRLCRERRMTKWGLNAFERRTSDISLLEKFKAEPITIPGDLLEALKKNRRAWTNFEQFARSYRRRYLMWISAAKRPDTRRKRIDEAVVLISRNIRALLK